MRGLRLHGEGRPDYKANPRHGDKGYGFESVVGPIRHLIGGLYWLLGSHSLFHHISPSSGREFTDWDDHYDDLVIAESDNFRLVVQDFVPTYAEFFFGDWSQAYGVTGPVPLENLQLDQYGFYKGPDVQVSFFCIDGNFWDVYSPNEQVLEVLALEFPSAQALRLEEKTY